MHLNKLISVMKERGFEGALISPRTNFYYLTGLHLHETEERPTLLVVNSDGEITS